MYACLGVTCHLHFWLDDQGLLCATAITRGWNEHQIRVGIQSELWRRKFSHRSCWESNSQPFNHESSTTCPPGSQYLIYHHCHLIHFVSPVPKVHSLEYQPCCAFLTFCTSGWKPQVNSMGSCCRCCLCFNTNQVSPSSAGHWDSSVS